MGRDKPCWFGNFGWLLPTFVPQLSISSWAEISDESKKKTASTFVLSRIKKNMSHELSPRSLPFSRISSANLDNLSLHRFIDSSNLKLSISLMYRSIAIHLDISDTSFVTWKFIDKRQSCVSKLILISLYNSQIVSHLK